MLLNHIKHFRSQWSFRVLNNKERAISFYLNFGHCFNTINFCIKFITELTEEKNYQLCRKTTLSVALNSSHMKGLNLFPPRDAFSFSLMVWIKIYLLALMSILRNTQVDTSHIMASRGTPSKSIHKCKTKLWGCEMSTV